MFNSGQFHWIIADFNRFHIVLFRAESHVSICVALAKALAVNAVLLI